MSIDFEAYYKNPFQDDRYIFHYTNQFKAMESILNKCVLYFSTRENCHDPFEQEDIVHTLSYENEADIGRPIQYVEEINKVRKSVKYACFSYDKDTITSYPWDKGCFRSRMWSQYSNAHQGVCLVLNYSVVRDAALQEMDGDAGTWIITDKLSYDNENNNLQKLAHLEKDDFSISPSERIKKYAKTYLFTKLMDYEHEQEYRICIYDGKDTNVIEVDISKALEGIIIGYKFLEIYLPVIKQISKRLSIPVVRSVWFRGYPIFENI